MTVTEIEPGVWKSGKGKGRHLPKGRQYTSVNGRDL